MSVFAESTTEGASSDVMTSLQSVLGRYPGILLDEHFIHDAAMFNRFIFIVWLVVGNEM